MYILSTNNWPEMSKLKFGFWTLRIVGGPCAGDGIEDFPIKTRLRHASGWF